MLDLSNNNGTHHDFRKAYAKGGQRRVYLKRCQGVTFVDKTFPTLRTRALGAGLTVGAYDFLEPLAATPREAADYLLHLLALPLKPSRGDLRPALDCEKGSPSAKAGAWIGAVANAVAKATGIRPLIYGSGYWLEGCAFAKAPGPLWLAAYGRNDGREYPVGKLPAPWRTLTAHQYTSVAHIVGIDGGCDLSHVFKPANIDLPKRRRP